VGCVGVEWEGGGAHPLLMAFLSASRHWEGLDLVRRKVCAAWQWQASSSLLLEVGEGWKTPAPPEGGWFFLAHQAGQTNQSLARHTGLESYTASEVWSRVCLGAASGIPAHHLYDTILHSLVVSCLDLAHASLHERDGPGQGRSQQPGRHTHSTTKHGWQRLAHGSWA
jgi:hypothetical protein